MDLFEKTTNFTGATTSVGGSLVTIFDGTSAPRTIYLNSFKKNFVYFGREDQNDIVLSSMLVSGTHGRFVYKGNTWYIEDKAVYENKPSTNGLIYNNYAIVSRAINDGDFIRIDDGVETISEGVLFVFSSADSNNKWNMLPLGEKQELIIGRESGCDIVLPHVSVSKCHAKIVREADGYYIADHGSTNGVIVNNKRISGKVKLHEKDVIDITNSKLIFTGSVISHCCYQKGISVDAIDIVIERRDEKGKPRITCNHASVGIRPGELVAIIGGSGAGKSTLLNCMCGYLKPKQGNVYVNGVDLYRNFDSLKKLIGYVPQSDIVYDNLTLYDMLMYTAKLRLPKDTSAKEREAAIDRAIENEAIKGLFLLAVPLKIAPKPRMVANLCKVYFDKIKPDDVVAQAAKRCYGIAQDKNPFHYIGWLPRYFELFAKAKQTRARLSILQTPTVAFQSRRDELVSGKSAEMLQQNARVSVVELKNSGHYYYASEDFSLLLSEFEKFINKRE